MTDAVNTEGDLVYAYPQWVVLLSEDSTPPTSVDDDFVDTLNAATVVQSAGSTIDYADLIWKRDEVLVDRVQPEGFSRMVSVVLPDDDDTQIFVGDYTTEREHVTPDGEELTARGQLLPYHFGKPFEGQLWYDFQQSEEIVTRHPPIFNPEIDGRVLGNMSDATKETGDSFLFCSPEYLTSNSQDATSQIPSEWTLKDALLAICEACNPDETILKNPTAGTTLDDAPEIVNLIMPIGKYLPHYLDALLQPLGYNWYVAPYNPEPEDPPVVTPPLEIKLFEKGVGTERVLWFQAPDEQLDLDESNINEFDINRDIANQPNAIDVLGGWEEIEVTLPLYPTWSSSLDATTRDNLDKISGSSYADNEHVWRKWAANEGGDYSGLRTDAHAAGEPPTMDSIFTLGYVPHRRKIYEPLTRYGDVDNALQQPVLVEYSTDAGVSWQTLDDVTAGNFLLADDEIAVLFNSDKPPEAMYDAGANARMRITGTIRGDGLLLGAAAKQSSAVNGREHKLVLDMPEKFQLRKIIETPDEFSSVLEGHVTEERDDSDAITTYAEKLRDLYETAELSCKFRLPGWHLSYEIGDLLTNIEGREISLNQASTTGTAKYVQVVERQWHFDKDLGPSTVLIVDRGDVTPDSVRQVVPEFAPE